jgi:hypothetical protein
VGVGIFFAKHIRQFQKEQLAFSRIDPTNHSDKKTAIRQAKVNLCCRIIFQK